MFISTKVRMIAVLSLVATMSACMFTGTRSGAPLVSVMFITREPPVERVEVVSVRPSEESVWIGGHWYGRGNSYVWTPGRWQRPDAGTKEWENGKWVHEQRGWYYSEGHWR
jgi:YXWGXW repeat-containing protein